MLFRTGFTGICSAVVWRLLILCCYVSHLPQALQISIEVISCLLNSYYSDFYCHTILDQVAALQSKCYGEELAHQELLHVELSSPDKFNGVPTIQSLIDVLNVIFSCKNSFFVRSYGIRPSRSFRNNRKTTFRQP